ncbi:DDB1- and CUL4-associated factor 12 [Cimex lectularius]|uniref:DDB1- and CUL4-associated factor 12 beta-propeller domain-containing protein n=1 Tax=Cimex lectularius TaxID=79782 RepID=A0A8I6REI5_CIMLE|nr:DDB1- and CUL4-associated factor 12 [Cimex lectularius]
MASTVRKPVYGKRPPCSYQGRLEERILKACALRLEKSRKPEKPEDFICYTDSDEEEDTPASQQKILNTSFSIVDYIRSREMGLKESRTFNRDYGSRHILAHDMFREHPISLNNMNKVFCSQWLSDRQVVFGTKCNKLMVYDVVTERIDQIPSLNGKRETNLDAPQADSFHGIHAVQINPSHTLLASGAKNSNEIAVYRLPTLDPVCVGQGAHRDWVLDLCWLDDKFLVSGSTDTRLALWKFDEENTYLLEDSLPCYLFVDALDVRECKYAQKIRALAFNNVKRELAALSLNGYIHIWDVERFRQKLSRKLPSCQDNVCMAVQNTGALYAIGCKSYTLLLDSRTLQPVKKIPSRYSGCGIRSASFQSNILTIGTGVGMIMFYDLRAGKYLESSINSSRTVILKSSRGYVFPDEELMDGFHQVKYTPAIYTHCYDFSGTRLFSAGGPLPANIYGNYAGLWQ